MASVNVGATLDGLRRSATAADPVAGALVTRAVERYRAPVRVQVTGRAGVGRTAVVACLGPITGAKVVETAAWDVPGAEDPALTAELIVLVVCDPPRRADLAAASVAGDRVLVVLNKADTLADRDGSARRCAESLGSSCLPVDAGRSGAGGATSDSSGAGGATSDSSGAGGATRESAAAGVDDLRLAVAGRLVAVRARRAAALLATLRALTGTASARDAVEEYLAGDEALAVAVAAIVPRKREVPPASQQAAPEPPLQRARAQRGRMNGGFDARSTRSALALHRKAVREWARGELR